MPSIQKKMVNNYGTEINKELLNTDMMEVVKCLTRNKQKILVSITHLIWTVKKKLEDFLDIQK
jgi:hypothetical protein